MSTMVREIEEAPFERFRTSDGVTISYRRWGDPVGQVVLLQHGFTSDTVEDWVDTGVVGALIEAGLSVIGVDARGHGNSDAPHSADAYGFGRFAADLLELTVALGIRQFDVVGYSMGAVVALNAAMANDSVRKVVIGGIGGSLVELGGVDTRIVAVTSFVHSFLVADPGEISDPGLQAWRTAVDAAGKDRIALGYVAATMGTGGVDVKEVSAPTLLLAGNQDPFASEPELVTAAMSDATLIVLDGDHSQPRNTAQFRDSIVEFLTAI